MKNICNQYKEYKQNKSNVEGKLDIVDTIETNTKNNNINNNNKVNLDINANKDPKFDILNEINLENEKKSNILKLNDQTEEKKLNRKDEINNNEVESSLSNNTDNLYNKKVMDQNENISNEINIIENNKNLKIKKKSKEINENQNININNLDFNTTNNKSDDNSINKLNKSKNDILLSDIYINKINEKYKNSNKNINKIINTIHRLKQKIQVINKKDNNLISPEKLIVTPENGKRSYNLNNNYLYNNSVNSSSSKYYNYNDSATKDSRSFGSKHNNEESNKNINNLDEISIDYSPIHNINTIGNDEENLDNFFKNLIKTPLVKSDNDKEPKKKIIKLEKDYLSLTVGEYLEKMNEKISKKLKEDGEKKIKDYYQQLFQMEDIYLKYLNNMSQQLKEYPSDMKLLESQTNLVKTTLFNDRKKIIESFEE